MTKYFYVNGSEKKLLFNKIAISSDQLSKGRTSWHASYTARTLREQDKSRPLSGNLLLPPAFDGFWPIRCMCIVQEAMCVVSQLAVCSLKAAVLSNQENCHVTLCFKHFLHHRIKCYFTQLYRLVILDTPSALQKLLHQPPQRPKRASPKV